METGETIDVGRSSAVAVADWNADGHPDLIIGNMDGGVFWAQNAGQSKTVRFRKPERLLAAGHLVIAKSGDAAPCIADWDGDGRLDLLLGSGDGSVVWFRNVGSAKRPRLAAPQVLVPAVSAELVPTLKDF